MRKIATKSGCLECGKEKELHRSAYCNKCRDALIMAKIKGSVDDGEKSMARTN